MTKDFQEIDFAEEIKGIVRKPLTPEEYGRMTARVMRATPPIFDEHPALRDRLAMTGLKDLAKHAMTTPDALEKIVGSSKIFLSAVNEYYRRGVMEESVAELRAIREENLKTLEDFDPGADYPLDECVRRINALGEFSREEERKELTRRSCERFPEAPDLRCILLTDRLESTEDGMEQAEIIAQMEETVRQSPMLIYMVNDALLTHYLEQGETEKIKKFFDFRDAASQKNSKRLKAAISKNDKLSVLPLNDVKRKTITEELSKLKFARRLYAVERRYDGLIVGSRFLVIQPKMFYLGDPKSDISQIQELFPEFRIVTANRKFCAQYLDILPGSLIWDRKGGIMGKACDQSEPGKAS